MGERVHQTNERYVHHREAWGILNPFGQLWTSDYFATAAAAQKHVNDYWRNPMDRVGFRPVRVQVVTKLQIMDDTPSPQPGERHDG